MNRFAGLAGVAVQGYDDFVRYLLLITVIAFAGVSPAAACPMCKAANEAPQTGSGADAELRPRAYMYSIFFMMGMPVVAGGVVTIAVRREIRRARERDPAHGAVS